MPRYAQIRSGVIFEFKVLPNQPPDLAHKGITWLPCPEVAKPSIDPKTHKVTGPTYAINASDVTEQWASVALTTEELSGAKAAAISSINGPYRPVMKALLDHENRLRAKDSPPKTALTLAEYETAFRDLL
jgi:hypothetical protein